MERGKSKLNTTILKQFPIRGVEKSLMLDLVVANGRWISLRNVTGAALAYRSVGTRVSELTGREPLIIPESRVARCSAIMPSLLQYNS
jgi:hypothetical protein